MNLSNLLIDDAILHQLPLDPSTKQLADPVLSTAKLELLPEDKEHFRRQVVRSLGKGSAVHKMELETVHNDSAIHSIANIVGGDDEELLAGSQSLAWRFRDAHRGRSVKPGVLIILRGQVGESGDPILILIKAEFYEAIRVTTEGVLRLLDSLIMGPSSKVFKIAGFRFINDDAWDIGLRDEQSSTRDSPAAQYFYRDFLGLTFSSDSPESNLRVYNAAREAVIATAATYEDRARALSGINSYFHHDLTEEIHPAVIADRYLRTPRERDIFREKLDEAGIPDQAFRKDLSKLTKARQQSTFKFSSGITLLVPDEVDVDQASIKTETVNGEEWTHIRVRGRVVDQ